MPLIRLTIALLLLISLAAGGCATGPAPLSEGDLEQRDADLLTIRDAMGDIVESAHDDPHRSWHSGWVGNALVNIGGKSVYGCCYHWQELVYFEIKPLVLELGWDVSGIEINRGTRHEHHAVLVWDPDRIPRTEALAAPRTDPVYVLDAWRRGRTDIYALEDWLDLPRPDMTPLAFEDLDALEDPAQAVSSR